MFLQGQGINTSRAGNTLSTSNPLYDAPSREIYLLENVAIQGRKTELRQLLKLLNLAKTGQPKAALITGDVGIGKTALLETFVGLVREGIYCRILHLGSATFNSVEDLYVAIIEGLQAEANDILDEALVAVNGITQELDLHWERQDLVRAIALVKLQESIGGKQAVSQEQLLKAIRSQVPAVKKLKLSVNESIEKLVDLIVNPWVMVATSLLNPMGQPLQEAIQLAETLKAKMAEQPAENPVLPQLDPSAITALPESIAENGVANPQVKTAQQEATQKLIDDFYPPATSEPATVAESAILPAPVLPVTRIETPLRPIKDPLIHHLLQVFNFINSAIENLDTALLMVIDEWDRIQGKPAQQALKDFLAELLYHITEQKNYHFMMVMSARSEGESYTLGGPLYNHFRTKLLLDALPDSACRKLLRGILRAAGTDVDEEVNRRVYQLSRGNPGWHLKMAHYMAERAENNRLRNVDIDFYEKLGVEKVENIAELAFTRLKLTFLNDEESLYKVIAALLKLFEERPFSANQAIKEISTSQGFTDGYVFEVLRALYRHNFIREATKTESAGLSQGEPDARTKRPDPCYVIQSRTMLQFLQEKTRAIETDISTDEKLMYLKKIIPLSIKSGELDREKTMEVLALSDAMNRPEVVQFLEDTFIENLQDGKPVVRVTALNNVALLDSPRAREALFRAMRDEDSMVREYAARNLALLSQKSSDPQITNRIIETMSLAVDDESEAVRAQVYGTLSKYKWHRELLTLFIKGTADACDSVRITAVQTLAETESDSPYLINALLDALSDPVADVRRYACMGLQKFSNSEVIEALVRVLQSDADSSIRALAADSLSRMEEGKALQALIHALRYESSEEVKLAVARALGKRRGWQTEEILLEALQNADPAAMPVFTWACIRSLGQVGGTERSLSVLAELRKRLTNTILLSAIDVANQKIYGRIDELRQIERQLEEATPLTQAVPSEYQEDVALPEEEIILETPFIPPATSAGQPEPMGLSSPPRAR
jgi:HEAT repeat protein/Cdc6-like AAA superfamily ATPase